MLRFLLVLLVYLPLHAQQHVVTVRSPSGETPMCNLLITGQPSVYSSDSTGTIVFPFPIERDSVQLKLYCQSFEPQSWIVLQQDPKETQIILQAPIQQLHEVTIRHVVSPIRLAPTPLTTMRYDAAFFEKNPVTNLLDMVPHITGVRQQTNCNVCGTSDIHINGLEGPYTLVVLDDVPLVGGLSSVYGLAGIPSFFLENLEVTKGPASSAFGSEAIGGVIHAKTIPVSNRFQVGVQQLTTSNLESTTDFGVNIPLGKHLSVFTSGQWGSLRHLIDQNTDGFTDVPLYDRIAGFQRWSWRDTSGFDIQFCGKFLREKRWGGQLTWNEDWLGSDSIYGEHITTQRLEAQLVVKHRALPRLRLLQHVNQHRQQSFYGTMPFHARQAFSFSQVEYRRSRGKHQRLLGGNLRILYYNDNSVLTQSFTSLQDSMHRTIQPGVFWEENRIWNTRHHTWVSFRLDFHPVHRWIPTTRLAHQFSWKNQTLRMQAGTGFRVVNLFSEDHAALTGSRKIIINEQLLPERSWSSQISHEWKRSRNNQQFQWITSVFYTYFSNQIIADYDSHPDEIRYQNLVGYARTTGIQHDFSWMGKQWSYQVGVVVQDVRIFSSTVHERPMLTEQFSGTMAISYKTRKQRWSFDYTHFWVGSMRLPRASALDPRPVYSRPYIIHNLQASFHYSRRLSVFGGVKNLLNWTPNRGIPFLIARAHDPFDKQVTTDATGQVVATAENPYALTFDPTYVYAANEGIRIFLGFRWRFDKK